MISLPRIMLVWILANVVAACGDPIDRQLNPVSPGAPGNPATPAAAAFHRTLFVADLHADTLATDRDFFEPDQTAGHVDLPRLLAGNVGLQAFTVFTDTPFPGADGCVNGDDTNFAAILQAIQLRPVATWFSQQESALYQARRLHQLRDESLQRARDGYDGRLMLIETADDVATLVASRQRGEPLVGALLGLEGGHALEGEESNVDVFFNAGFRMIAPTHRFDNELASASEGCGPTRGLTRYGRKVIEAAAKRRMVIDVAHAASPVIEETSAMALEQGFPIVSSHGGVYATCPRRPGARVARNLKDSDIRAIARTGGIVGIGFWPEAVCWDDDDGQSQRLEAIAAAMSHTLEVLKAPAFVAEMQRRDPAYDPAEHVALGSDYDGAVRVPFDAGGLALLTQTLLDYREDDRYVFDERTLRKIAGANVCRVLARQLPGGSDALAHSTCDPLLASKAGL